MELITNVVIALFPKPVLNCSLLKLPLDGGEIGMVALNERRLLVPWSVDFHSRFWATLEGQLSAPVSQRTRFGVKG